MFAKARIVVLALAATLVGLGIGPEMFVGLVEDAADKILAAVLAVIAVVDALRVRREALDE